MRIFHYTTYHRMQQIIQSGEIKPSTEFKDHPSPTGKRIKSPVWLTSNEGMEMAIIKPTMTREGVRVELSLHEYHKVFGICRLEIKPSSKTLSVMRLMKALGVPAMERDSMLKFAKLDGCDPDLWYGTVGRIKFKDVCGIQVYAGQVDGKHMWDELNLQNGF